jgi:protocatechuate 3,4-dioxygenase beta subunit
MKSQIIRPEPFYIPMERRKFLKAIAAVSAGFTLPGYLAEVLATDTNATSLCTQGPYYPTANAMPLTKDNDLLYVNDNTTKATGTIQYIYGRILDRSGNPINGALVELWHADNGGSYIYQTVNSPISSSYDSYFQGFGQCLTGSGGYYKFRTIKAGLYTPRTRHYHLAVTIPGATTRICTQLFWNETCYNSAGKLWWQPSASYTASSASLTATGSTDCSDQVFKEMVAAGTTQAQLNKLILTYTTLDATTGEQAANFDFIVGSTPTEVTYPSGSGALLIAGAQVAGPTNSLRYKLSIPCFTNYTYEVYGNPSLFDVGSGSQLTNLANAGTRTNMGWGSLPFAISQTGNIVSNRFTTSTNGTLDLFLKQKSTNGFYFVTFRPPGSNTGVP